MKTQEDKTLTQQHIFGCQLLFLSTEILAYELLQSFPPSFPLPQETTQSAWEQEHLFTG